MATAADLSKARELLDAARARYHEIVNTAPAPEVQAVSAKIHELMDQNAHGMAEGAQKCPTCGNLPIGIKHDDKVAMAYEVGCAHCPDHRAVARTREEAIAKFNAGQYTDHQGNLPSTDPSRNTGNLDGGGIRLDRQGNPLTPPA
jgi:hypothetical protein